MIPDELIATEQWICWTEEERQSEEGTKLTKVPRAPWNHGGNAAANDPENWTDYETASEWVDMTPKHGLGFVFSPDGPFVGVDLDDCLTDDGKIKPSASDIVSRVNSFTEISPSRTGLHIICKGELDNALKNDDRGVEIYDRDRFFTVTGDELHHHAVEGYDAPLQATPVNQAQDALDFLMDEYMVHQDEAPSAEPADLDTDRTPDMPSGDAHPMYDLTVRDVYPTLPAGENIEHPVHGSSTGANFKVHDHDPTAVCWRGEHQYGTKQGCILCAWHLLAMEGTNLNDCRDVRRSYTTDDSLVFHAWKEAYQRGLVTGENPPWRAVQYIANQHGLADMTEGGKTAWATYRACCRIIRSAHDIPVTIEDDND